MQADRCSIVRSLAVCAARDDTLFRFRLQNPSYSRYRRETRSPFRMRAIWKGSISFGLVNIPIALYPATRKEELKFRLLRAADHSPVNYKRVAEKDGKEVPWDQIVKGYEYEKGKFVVLNEKDFQRVDLEATQTVDIQDFVEIEEIDPMYFYKPYYLEPQKGGDKAYVLLREALADGKISPLPIRKPSRTRGSRYGQLLIDSMPPATAMSMSPVAMPWAASITAFRPEPHTLLIVSAAT